MTQRGSLHCQAIFGTAKVMKHEWREWQIMFSQVWHDVAWHLPCSQSLITKSCTEAQYKTEPHFIWPQNMGIIRKQFLSTFTWQWCHHVLLLFLVVTQYRCCQKAILSTFIWQWHYHVLLPFLVRTQMIWVSSESNFWVHQHGNDASMSHCLFW